MEMLSVHFFGFAINKIQTSKIMPFLEHGYFFAKKFLVLAPAALASFQKGHYFAR
jgi:hypothetical protein